MDDGYREGCAESGVKPVFLNQRERQRIAGLATRTTNADEAEPSQAKIGELWGRFMTQNWAERLGQAGALGPTLAVYSAYEGDASGSYQILVGRELAESSPVPPPVQVVDIAPGQYLVFRCSGPLPGAVIEGWRAVWAFFERPDVPRRAYTADFEKYVGPERVEIWVAVRA
jgi:predicted transcriptional regulator YdeE